MGFRLFPIFVYHHSTQNSQTPNLYAISPGLSHRYFFADTQATKGFYAQLESSILFQSRHFQGNSSRHCFFNSLGLGFQFSEPKFSLALKIQHASNANLSTENKGVNGVSFSVGYTFN
jgi:hypothetical protein